MDGNGQHGRGRRGKEQDTEQKHDDGELNDLLQEGRKLLQGVQVMIILGLIPTSAALVLATQLVVAQAIGLAVSLVTAGVVAVLIGVVWWVLPLTREDKL